MPDGQQRTATPSEKPACVFTAKVPDTSDCPAAKVMTRRAGSGSGEQDHHQRQASNRVCTTNALDGAVNDGFQCRRRSSPASFRKLNSSAISPASVDPMAFGAGIPKMDNAAPAGHSSLEEPQGVLVGAQSTGEVAQTGDLARRRMMMFSNFPATRQTPGVDLSTGS